MLGRLLELALVTEDTGAAWLRYQSLGFAPATAGDVWRHAYGVVACPTLAIGLHARGDEPLSLLFVRPDVAQLHRELVARGVRVEQAQLGSDVFNELTLREPGGIALRVIEARTFSPPAELTATTRLGTLRQLSLPCRDFTAVAAFWQQLGLAVATQELPWEGLPLPGMPLAWHRRAMLPEPALIFDAPFAPDDALLEECGLRRERPLPHADPAHLRLRTAEDLTLIVLS